MKIDYCNIVNIPPKDNGDILSGEALRQRVAEREMDTAPSLKTQILKSMHFCDP